MLASAMMIFNRDAVSYQFAVSTLKIEMTEY